MERSKLPSTYKEAREQFIRAAKKRGCSLESYILPEYVGFEGEDLFVDVAKIGNPNSQRLIVINSGIHGVEGFAGSVAQTYILNNYLVENIKDYLFIFIHALNPYGFSHKRRVNENNVDLNRNFLNHGEVSRNDKDFSELKEKLFNVKNYRFLKFKFYLKLLRYIFFKGVPSLQSVIQKGQYEFKDEIFYGGGEAEWSNKFITTFSNSNLVGKQETFFVDLHTGLGKYGECELMLGEEKDSKMFKKSINIWGDKLKSTYANESSSVRLSGSLREHLKNIIGEDSLYFVTLEVGVKSKISTLYNLWFENLLFKNDTTNLNVKENLFRVFFPNDKKWLNKYLSNVVDTLDCITKKRNLNETHY